MLYYETIDPKTLELLKNLQNTKLFSELRLVGGTSLALQIGHRKSIDLDLFGNLESDEFTVLKEINKLGIVKQLKKTENINIFLIDNVKVDIVNYHYKWIDEKIEEKGLILAGEKDIAAMKLSAISGRGTKKDFIDLFFLLKKYSLEELFELYTEKFYDGSLFLVLKSLLYFNDADEDEDPHMLSPIDWGKIKEKIKRIVEDHIKTEAKDV